jgi:hypothetical protein
MIRKTAAVVVLTVAMSALTPFAARAGHVDPPDGNDTPGKLDVRRVRTGTGWRPYWKIGTFGTWRVRQIWDKGYFLVQLDTFGDSDFDYYALVRSARDRLRASLWRDRARKRDRFLRGLTAWRKTRRSVSVRVPLRSVRFPDSQPFYFWQARTLYQNSKKCRRWCIDAAPNQTPVAEPRPGTAS